MFPVIEGAVFIISTPVELYDIPYSVQSWGVILQNHLSPLVVELDGSKLVLYPE